MRPDAIAHHGFHVLAIYPWFAPPAHPKSALPLSVLDQCRIRWGTVRRRRRQRPPASARSPLTWDGTRLALGDEHEESVRWQEDGWAPAGAVEPGDVVACHWDWACDRLTPDQAEQLAERTARQLETLETA